MIKIDKVNYILANDRCKCGLCSHLLMEVIFDNGEKWYPTMKEFKALSEILKLVYDHNITYDKHCFRAEQEVLIEEICL